MRFKYLSIAGVSTAGNSAEADFMTPTSAVFAKALMDKIRCGKRIYMPSLAHAALVWVSGLLPESW